MLIKIYHRNLHRSQLLSGIRWNSPSIWAFRQVKNSSRGSFDGFHVLSQESFHAESPQKKQNDKKKWVKDVETIKNHLPALMI